MEHKFECQNCGQRMSANEDLFGTDTVCPTCSKPLVIPFPRAITPPTATPPPVTSAETNSFAECLPGIILVGLMIFFIVSTINRCSTTTTTPTTSSSTTRYTTVSGYIASESEEMLDTAISYLAANDKEAFNKLVDSGSVIGLKGGLEVQIMETKTSKGKVKIRPIGETIEVWTVSEAVK
jgi:hypothetical protein